MLDVTKFEGRNQNEPPKLNISFVIEMAFSCGRTRDSTNVSREPDAFFSESKNLTGRRMSAP